MSAFNIDHCFNESETPMNDVEAERNPFIANAMDVKLFVFHVIVNSVIVFVFFVCSHRIFYLLQMVKVF